METQPFQPKLPEIAESEQTPLVRGLLQIIADLQAQVRRLEDEIRRLQGGPPRPPLKPNTLEPTGTAAKEAADGETPRRRRGPQRAKTAELTIHTPEKVPVSDVPEGAEFKGYRRFVVQDLEIRTHNTVYLLEQWWFPTGEYVTAPVPATAVRGGHYGPQLVSYVLHQYDHAHVTQPLLLAQLHDWGIEISAGQLNRLLTEGHDAFHEEKAALKAAGLATSSYIQADDTGARHQGQNGYCTDLGNERFAGFASTDSKSRVNFLELLQAERRYAVNAEALAYIAQRGLAADHRDRLAARPVDLGTPPDWAAHLRRLGVESPRAVTLATEGTLIGGLAAQGFNLDIGLVSDDAGQDGQHAATLGGWQIPVSQYSANQEADIALTLHLAGPEVHKARAVELSQLPTVLSLYEDPEVLEANLFFAEMKDILASAVARPAAVTGSKYNQVSSEFFNAVHVVLSGGKSAEQSLPDLEASLKRMICGGRW